MLKVIMYLGGLYIYLTKATVYIFALIGVLYCVPKANFLVIQYILVFHCFTLMYFSLKSSFISIRRDNTAKEKS